MRSWSARLPGSSGRRLISLAALAAAWCAAAIVAPAPPAAAATLTTPPRSPRAAPTTGATGTSYLYTFTAATASSLSSVTMTLPTATAGTAAAGTVSPAVTAGGSATRAGTTLTYSFTAVTVAAGTFISIQVTGLTNTTAAGSYTSVITTRNGGTPVDTGTTGSVTFTAVGLTSAGWSASSTAVGATSVTYTFTFTTSAALLGVLTGATMTVPPGTSGTPVLGTVTPSGLLGGTISLSGTTLTYTGLSLLLLGSISGSIQVKGLTNTATAGSYTSEIVTQGVVDSGITPAVSFTGPLDLTSPGSLGWAATLNGANQSAVDGTAADQQFTVDDETATGPTTAAGWHITVAAVTFTSGSHTLANSGTLALTGSLTSVTATTGPSVSCVVSCTPPGNTTTYPVAITTAASAPTPATVFDAPVKTGLGPVLIGGHSAANPVGWWVSIPASARAGSYTSTVTVAVVSGP